MKEVDYIVVGLGIAGIAVCDRLIAASKSVIAFDSGKNTATSVAGGVVNPVVLKRFNPAWKSDAFFEEAAPFYSVLEQKLNVPFLSDIRIHRIFNSPEEQNDWIVASDSPVLENVLSSEILRNANESIKAEFGLGEVTTSFKIDTGLLLSRYKEFLESKASYRYGDFNHKDLRVAEGGFELNDIRASKVVFTEGSGALGNPYFKVDCLIPKKGEYLTIKAPKLNCSSILKGPFFLIPVKDDLYQVGATFAHGDFSFEPTSEGKQKMLAAIRKMINCEFEVVDQIVGMRPTVKDRRPILGSVDDSNIYFLNGLGTRGLLMAPLLSQWLINHIENEEPLPKEVDIKRFVD